MQPWFYSPFKSEKVGLPKYTTHWNFIQLSKKMSMERTFGMLKGIFKILLKRIGIPLHHMPNLVAICICLHNMHIANSNGFDMDWALNAQRDAQIETNTTFGNLKGTNVFKVVEEAIKQTKRLQNPRMVSGDDKNDGGHGTSR
jgi:hypothetical protein